jgi:flavin reductase (DIM6/NTAB) family NADH-FMN oxidoreductase RutF
LKKNIGPALWLCPTPVVLVGTYDENEKPNLATLAWVGICCSEPPSVQVSIRKNRHTHAAIVAREVFSVNVPSVKYVVETDFAGLTSGKDTDKFAATKLTPVRGQMIDAPLVMEFPISMECRLTHTLSLGSHDMFVGEILACWADDAVLGGNGKPDPKKIDPLAFTTEGGYFGLGDFIATSHNVGRKLWNSDQ